MAIATADNPEQGWRLTFTPEVALWYGRLGPKDRHRIAAAFDRLQERGPSLARPHADTVKGSRHHNMKELRSVGGHLRALFAFDPNRRAIVLVAGDKRNNWRGWYKQNIPRADKLYDEHLRKEGRWPPRAGGHSGGRSR